MNHKLRIKLCGWLAVLLHSPPKFHKLCHNLQKSTVSVFLVQDDAAAHQAAFFAHLKKAVKHKIEVKKADLLTGLRCLHNVQMHDQSPISI